MVSEKGAAGAADSNEGSAGGAPGGQMIYHMFAAEERRRIVSIFLDNHAVTFSAPAISAATGMDTATATEMLDSLEAVGFLAAMPPNEAYELAGSDDEAVKRIAGDLDEDPKFYHLDKDSEVAMALAKADTVAGQYAGDFFRAAPDIDRED